MCSTYFSPKAPIFSPNLRAPNFPPICSPNLFHEFPSSDFFSDFFPEFLLCLKSVKIEQKNKFTEKFPAAGGGLKFNEKIPRCRRRSGGALRGHLAGQVVRLLQPPPRRGGLMEPPGLALWARAREGRNSPIGP